MSPPPPPWARVRVHVHVPSRLLSSSSPPLPPPQPEIVAMRDKLGELKVFSSQVGGMAPEFFAYLCEKISTYVRDVLEVQVMSVSRGKLTASIKFKPSFIGNPEPAVIHGGVTASIIDHIGGFGAWTILPKSGLMLSTVDLRVEYIAPFPFKSGEEVIICEAEVVSHSEKLIITDIVCWNKDKTLKFAAGRGLYNVYKFKHDNLQQYGSKLINLLFRIPFTDSLGKYMMIYIAKLFMKRHKVSFLSKNRNRTLPGDYLQTPPNEIVFWNKTAKEYAEFVENYTPFGKDILGLKVQRVSRGELSCVMPYKKYFLGNFRQPCLHGGVPASLVDQCGGFCARSVLGSPSMHVSTVELTIDYLAPLPCFENIVCDAKVVSFSEKNIIITDVTCWNESRTKLLVVARCLFNVYTPKTNKITS
jgi:uncharacterized protein (TIGR00369 family)